MDIRTFKTYAEMDATHQNDVNNFPIVWMFGRKTDDEILEEISKIGAKSLDECMSICGGGVILKADEQKYDDMWKQHALEREAFTKSENNLFQMILSEMENHEYGYSRDPYDTLCAIGKTYKDLENDEAFRKAWKKAEKECFRRFNECN